MLTYKSKTFVCVFCEEETAGLIVTRETKDSETFLGETMPLHWYRTPKGVCCRKCLSEGKVG